jgi:hypothetical protein
VNGDGDCENVQPAPSPDLEDLLTIQQHLDSFTFSPSLGFSSTSTAFSGKGSPLFLLAQGHLAWKHSRQSFRPYLERTSRRSSTSARMSARFGMRFAQGARQPFTSRTHSHFRQVFKRWQGTAANPAVEGAPAQQSLFQRLWTSEVGIKTVHFWYELHVAGPSICAGHISTETRSYTDTGFVSPGLPS